MSMAFSKALRQQHTLAYKIGQEAMGTSFMLALRVQDMKCELVTAHGIYAIGHASPSICHLPYGKSHHLLSAIQDLR